MAEARRKPVPKEVIDVQRPGKTAADSTGKPIIVMNRQIIRDPMVTSEATTPVSEIKSAPALPKGVAVPEVTDQVATEEIESSPPEQELVDDVKPAVVSHEVVIAPPAVSEPEPEQKPEPMLDKNVAEPIAKPTTQAASTEKMRTEIPDAQTNVKAAEDAAEETEAKRQSELQKLADTKQYFLKIDAVKQRRTKQFIAFGIILSILLAIAWLIIALDAGLIQIDSVKPVTNFFSN